MIIAIGNQSRQVICLDSGIRGGVGLSVIAQVYNNQQPRVNGKGVHFPLRSRLDPTLLKNFPQLLRNPELSAQNPLTYSTFSTTISLLLLIKADHGTGI